jgi:hypothetical protein
VDFGGFAQEKMNREHAAESPKYAFQQVFQNYGYDQAGDAFKDLQWQYPDFFKDWSFNGVDKINYTGSDLPDVFGGVRDFDILENATGGGDKRWAWQDMTGAGEMAAQQAIGGGGQFNFGGAGGGGFGGSSGSSFSGPQFGGEVMAQLRGLFPDGAYNEDIVNRRTEMARENLQRHNKSRMATNRAALADRGLIGSGPEQTEAFNREENIADSYSQAASGIFADESENADNRMMQALQIAAGLTSEEARLIVDQFRAQTERDLGHGKLALDDKLGSGNLALGNMRAVNDYNMGLANYGLGRDRLLYDMEQGDLGAMLQILQMYMGGAQGSAGGFV